VIALKFDAVLGKEVKPKLSKSFLRQLLKHLFLLIAEGAGANKTQLSSLFLRLLGFIVIKCCGAANVTPTVENGNKDAVDIPKDF